MVNLPSFSRICFFDVGLFPEEPQFLCRKKLS